MSMYTTSYEYMQDEVTPSVMDVRLILWLTVHISLKPISHGPLTRYARLHIAHAPGMRRRFFPTLWFSDPDMQHGTCVTHLLWCMPGTLTSGFVWSRWRGKRSRHSRHMRKPQVYVSGKRPMFVIFSLSDYHCCLISSWWQTLGQSVARNKPNIGYRRHNVENTRI